MKKSLSIAFVIVSFLLGTAVGFSQQRSASFTTEKLAENVYLVKGGLANTGFIVGESVTAIDAQMTAGDAEKMIAEIKKTTPKPITRVILTHSDGDHVNGITGFPKGLEIISSNGAKEEMAKEFKAPNAQDYFPTRTFAEKLELGTGADRIQLTHFGPAHTSGDIVVFLPAQKLAFVGDLVFIGRDPLIHRHKGGSSAGVVKNLKAMLALDADRFVPGHGDVLTKADIEGAMKSLEDRQQKVKQLINEGKSLDEVKQAFGIKDGPPGGMRFPSLVEVIYLEFSGKK